MGWSGSAYYVSKLTHAFANFLRPTTPATTRFATTHKPLRRFLWNTRWRGARLLPHMNDFMFVAESEATTLLLCDRVNTLLHRLGILRSTNKVCGDPRRWATTSTLRSTSARAGGPESPPKSYTPSLSKPEPYSDVQPARPDGYRPDSLHLSPGRANFYTSPYCQPARFLLRSLHFVLVTRQDLGGRVVSSQFINSSQFSVLSSQSSSNPRELVISALRSPIYSRAAHPANP
jgi:hypothetical protein